jgi:hypothetical protein
VVPSESEGKEQQLSPEKSEKEAEEKDAAIFEKHPTATDSQTVTTCETAQTHDIVIPDKESKEEDASTAVGIEPNTASEATQDDDPPHGEPAVVSAVQAIAAPLAAAESGSRITTSPPCEVSSTTSSQGLEEAAPLPAAPPAAEDDKKVVHQLTGTTATTPRLVEGVIADSNNEKVLFEEEDDDEIDDVEPAVSAPKEGTFETAAAASSQVFLPLEESGAPNSAETERVVDPPQMISNHHSDPVPQVDHSASDAASAVEGGSLEAAALVNSDLISISVVDRTASQAVDRATEEGGEGEAAAEQKLLRKHHATTLDEVEDVSVTMVERKKRRPSSSPDRTMEKRRREEDAAVGMIDSRLMRVEADATAVTDHHHHPEPIVTISKVSAVKAAAPAASPGPTDASATAAARRTPVSSPSLQPLNPLQPAAAGTYSMFAQRMRGGGAQHPTRPGGLMMMGHHPPPRGFLMRGGFRGGGGGGGLRGAGTLPSLQPRPPLGGPMSLPPAGGFPSAAAGPVAEQLNRVAGKLANYMKHSLEDLFRDLSSQVGLQRQCLFD